MKVLVGYVGMSRATIYRNIEKGRFPKPVAISPRCVGWRRSEVQTWLAELKGR
jgi:prophage regulatory protein